MTRIARHAGSQASAVTPAKADGDAQISIWQSTASSALRASTSSACGTPVVAQKSLLSLSLSKAARRRSQRFQRPLKLHWLDS
jgi:hypothetical protein